MSLDAITYITNLLAMAISLWMAFYLFARGFPNQITLRAVLALLAISVFFLGTYNQFFNSYNETSHLRASLLVIALACWYSVTFAILPVEKQKKMRWMEITVYSLVCVSIFLLLTNESSIARAEDEKLYTARLNIHLVDVLYGVTQLVTSAGVLFNLAMQHRIRNANESKYFMFASLFLVFALVYGVLSLFLKSPTPRVIEDAFVFGGIFLLGVSVARHQSLVERRTIWQDFPIVALGMLSIVAFYMLIFFTVKLRMSLLGNFIAVVIISHSLYDLAREIVERWRISEETYFRRKITSNTIQEDKTLQNHLQEKLILFLQVVNASGGLIAINQNGKMIVWATANSQPLESEFVIPSDHATEKNHNPEATWVSIAYEGMQPIALVNLNHPDKKIKYSSGELDLLDEFSEQIGTFVSIHHLKENTSQSTPKHVLEDFTVPTFTEANLIKSVENGLRHFSDYLVLGQLPLAELNKVADKSQVERGKHIQVILREAIQSMKPEGERPPEPLPREWYNYVVLNDAYVRGVPNREVMARLYVSEGTFHRIRRHAIRGVARYLEEKRKREQES